MTSKLGILARLMVLTRSSSEVCAAIMGITVLFPTCRTRETPQQRNEAMQVDGWWGKVWLLGA
jgi:hypothetical protein